MADTTLSSNQKSMVGIPPWEKPLIKLEDPLEKLKQPNVEPVGPIPPTPVLNPQLSKDLLAYLEAMEILEEVWQKIKAMAAGLKHMKNVMYGVIEIMNMFQNIEGAKMRVLSSVDNVDSDLRSLVTSSQGAVNAITGSQTGKVITPNAKQEAEAQKFYDGIQQIQAFIDAHGGAKGIAGDSILKNLQEAINNIKTEFGWKSNKQPGAWGNKKAMAERFLEWARMSRSAKDGGTGTFSPQLRNIQFGFQQLNQTVSALSTTTNTQLQFTSEMFKQFLGIAASAMESYQKGNLQMVQNQKTN